MEATQPTPAGTEPSPAAGEGGVTVVIPTFNERDNLPVLIERLHIALEAAGRPHELLIVDDASPDGTAEAARALAARFPITVRVRTDERGLATAMLHGIQHARFDICVGMDADLSHPPEVVPDLCMAVETGARFALGSRYVAGGATRDWSPLRWLNSIGATWLARPLTRVHDPMSGFFAVRRSEVAWADLNPIGYKIALEILVKSRIDAPVEVPITFTDRLHGASKLDMSERLRYLRHLERLYRWRFPFATQLASFLAVGSVGMLVDFSVLTFAVEVLGWWFGFARILAFFAAVTVNFLLNDRFTFRSHERSGRPPAATRYLRFVGSCAVGLLVNWSTATALYATVPLFQRYYVAAAFCGVVAGTSFNFLGSRAYAFGRADA
jgi:dolichol-phosphate mannosyltransferase